MGTDQKGNSFTIPIGMSATATDNSVKLTLAKGIWNFSAIGWTGANQFSGSTQCDVLDIELKDDTQTVSLNVASSKCAHPQFGNASAYGNNFNPLRIITCGGLYTNMAGSIVDDLTSASFCQAPNLAVDLIDYAKSIKLEIPNIQNGVITPGISVCLNSSSEGVFTTTHLLPTKRAPLKIKLYESTACDETNIKDVMADYFFREGLASTYVKQDFYLNPVNSITNLFLPSNFLKRGYNSLLSLLPKIDCNGSACFNLPTVIPSGDRLLSPGEEFVLIENATAAQTCAGLSITASGITNWMSLDVTRDCRKDKNRIIIRPQFTAIPSVGTLGYNFGGVANTNLSVRSFIAHTSYRIGLELFGIPTSASASIQNSFRAFFDADDSKKLGILSRVRESLTPSGETSLLGSFNCATGVNKEEMITLLDEGVLETYRAILTDSTLPVPAYICSSATSVYDPNCSKTFDKKIVFQKLSKTTPVFETERIIHLRCNEKVGQVEGFKSETNRIEKGIIYWNTESNVIARLESYKSDQEFKADGTLKYLTNVFVRMEKTENLNARSQIFQFNNHETLTAGQYSSTAYHAQLHNTASKFFHLFEATTAPDDLFGGAYDGRLKDLSHIPQYRLSESPNGRYILKTYLTGACPSTVVLNIKIFDRQNLATPLTQTYGVDCVVSNTKTHSSINDSGRAIVGVMVGTTDLTPKVYTFNGSLWTNMPVTTGFTGSDYGLIKVHVFSNDKAIAVWDQYVTAIAPFTSVMVAKYTTLAGTPAVVEAIAPVNLNIQNIDLAISSSETAHIFAAQNLTTGKITFLTAGSSFTIPSTAVSVALSGTSVVDVSTEATASSVKFHITSSVGGGVNQRKTISISENVNPYTIATSADVAAPPPTAVSSNCMDKAATTFGDNLVGGCTLVESSFMKPIKTQIRSDLYSLKPSNFDLIFTPNFKAQN